VRHFVLTRSAYPAGYDANKRRLALLKGVTVPSMLAQTNKDWTWVVLLERDDPFKAERMAAFASVGVTLRVFYVQHPTVSLYQQDWAGVIGLPFNEPTLTTRLDDDDALAPDFLERIRTAAEDANEQGRVVWMLPEGFRVYRGRYAPMRHEANSWATLQTPPGDSAVVYDFGHKRIGGHAPIRLVDDKPAWLFVRHADTRSRNRAVSGPITVALRRLFPVDWELVGGLT
jgi:hypothetical protein